MSIGWGFHSKNPLSVILLLCSCFLNGCGSMCPTEQFDVRHLNNTLTIRWLETTDKINFRVSNRHRCLDEYKHYVTRKCGRRGWMPDKQKISCPYVIDEYEIRTTCPPNFWTFPGVLDNIRICFRITSEQPWANTCLLSGSSLVLSELNLTDRVSIHQQLNSYLPGASPPIWLPAKQMWLKKSKNPLQNARRIGNQTVSNSIQWTLAGIHGLQVQLSNIQLQYIDGCLLTQLQPNLEISRVLTNCNNPNTIICLYNQLEPTMLPLSCPPGYRTTRYSTLQNICIKIHRFPESFSQKLLSDEFVKEKICENVFPINSGSTLYIFQELARLEKLNESDRCMFKIVPDRVIINMNDWLRMDMNEIDFVNWSFNTSTPKDTISSEMENHILVTKSNGEWVWQTTAVTCAICFLQNKILLPIIELYEYDTSSLIVRIEQEEFLWRDQRRNGFSCFVFVYAKNQIETVETTYHHFDGLAKIYNISTIGEGRYWCTGLQIQSFKVIETEIVHIQRLIQFALIVQRPSYMLPSMPFHSIIKRFRNFLSSFLDPQHLVINNVSLNLTTTETLLFHVVLLIKSEEFREFEENRLNVSDTLLASYYVRHELNEIRLSTNESTLFNILSLNSTMFCLPESISQLNEINWTGARIGQYITSVEFCLLRTGLPVTKRCIGDSLFGGVWMPSPGIFECRNDLQSIVTYNLHNLTNSYLTSENTSQVIYQMIDIVFESDYSYLIGADIFYVSQIVMDVATYMRTYPLDDEDILEVLRLYDRLLMVNKTVTISAAPLNTTNVLLSTLDTILTSVTLSEENIYELEVDDGVTSVLQPRLSTFKISPSLTNITGVAVLNEANSTAPHEWTEYVFQYLYQNDTIADILAIPNLIVASYIPEQLLLSLNDTDLHIIITLFINDVLFQMNNETAARDSSTQYVNSSGSIISIIIPGIDKILPHKLPIFLNPNQRNEHDVENVCGYWNYIDGWAVNGCALSTITSSTVLCECTHLTHFAYLFHGHSQIPPEHLHKLNKITLIGCSLSLAGVFGIYLSAILFQQWRKLCSTKFLLQFSTAIAFEMIMVLVNTEENSLRLLLDDNIFGCVALGALLHYSVLVTFFWMFIIAYMQYMRYVIVFHKLKTTHFFFKSSVFGWAIPFIPILLVLLIDPMSYVPDLDVFSYKICYPSGFALYFAVMTPIALITFANFIIFFLVIKSLATDSDLVRRTRDKSTLMSQLRLSIFLFFLLGLTWIFAFLSSATTGLVFTYLFCVTATLQGFILFFYFIVLDPVVRKLWVGLFRRIFSLKF